MASDGAAGGIPSVIQWVNAHASAQASSWSDLGDGVALAQVLAEIAPDHCDVDELELDAGTNKLLRENNVSLVEDALKAHVAADLLAVDGDGPPQVVDIDARTIGREVAVRGPQRQRFIKHIMTMDAAVQEDLKQAIQEGTEIMAGGAVDDQEAYSDGAESFGSDDGGSTNHDDVDVTLDSSETGAGDTGRVRRRVSGGSSVEDLSDGDDQHRKEQSKMMEQLRRRVRELELDNERLSGENGDLIERADKLAKEKAQLEQVEDIRASGSAAGSREYMERRSQALTDQLKLKEEELAEVEARSDARVKSLEDQLRQQADELDMLNEKVTAMATLEANLERYKARLQMVPQLKSNIKQLEDEKNGYFEKILNLESELSSIPKLNSQLKAYKDKLVDLETSQAEDKEMVHVKQAEIDSLRGELEAASGRKRELEQEVTELKASLEAASSREDDDDMAPLLPTEVSEKLARLEHENRLLKAKNGSDGDGAGDSAEVDLLKSQLEDYQLVKEKLQKAASASRARVLQLESKLEEASKASAGASSKEVDALERENKALTANLADTRAQLSDMRTKQDEQSALATVRANLKAQVKELTSKVDKLSGQKAQLSTNLGKAIKLVERAKVAKQKTEALLTAEKAARETFERTSKEQQIELRLMMSSFYKIGAERQRRLIEPGANADMRGAGWTTRSRQTRRFGPSE